MRELARQQKELEEAYEPLIRRTEELRKAAGTGGSGGKPQRSTLPGRRISGISPGKKRRKQSLTPGFRRSWKEMSSPLRRSFPGSRSARRSRRSFWTSGKKLTWKNQQDLENLNGQYLTISDELAEKERVFVQKEEFEPELQEFLSTRKTEKLREIQGSFHRSSEQGFGRADSGHSTI